MSESNVSLANISYDYDCKYFRLETDFEKIAKHTAYVLLIVLGIPFNIFIIILAAKFTVRKNLHHFIVNMAVSDALFLFVRLWNYVITRMSDRWSKYHRGVLGVILCKTSMFLLHSSYTVSLITLLIISIERFKATRQRLQRSRQYTLNQRLLVIGISWLISTPFAVYYATLTEVKNGKACFLGWTEFVAIISISNCIVIAYLCCIVLFLSILTIRRLTKPQAIQNHLSQEQRTERARRTQAAVRMVLASVLLYICCWIPCSVYSMSAWINSIIPSTNIFSGVCIDLRSLNFIVVILLPNINSCFSPCIYIIFSTDLRQAAKKVFCRRNTLNQAPDRRNSFEMQPMARRRRNCQEEDIEL